MGLFRALLSAIMGDRIDTEDKQKDTPAEADPRPDTVAAAREGSRLYEMMAKGECPDCGSHKGFGEGPSGGMSTNVKCLNCGSWFNVTPMIRHVDRIGKKD